MEGLIMYYIRHVIKVPRGMKCVGVDTQRNYEEDDKGKNFFSTLWEIHFRIKIYDFHIYLLNYRLLLEMINKFSMYRFFMGKAKILFPLIASLVITAAYAPTFSGEFILDDMPLVKNNLFIRELKNPTFYLF